jgi:hypothetical protein
MEDAANPVYIRHELSSAVMPKSQNGFFRNIEKSTLA